MAHNPQKFNVEIPIEKVNNEQQLVFGWANVVENSDGTPVIDAHGDTIDIAELEYAAYDFVMSFSPVAGIEHAYPCGSLVESCVFSKAKIDLLGLTGTGIRIGWWVGFKIWYSDVWEDVKSGKLKMFSIGGTAVREEDTAEEPGETA